jgi:hypothetical protein
MDVNNLLKALDDTTNESLFDFTTKKMEDMTLSILKELHLSKKETIEMFHKLKGYKYIDEIKDLKYGTFIRWIPIDNPSNIYLTKGAIFCKIKITDNGVVFVYKNFGFPARYYEIMLDKNLIFQKLTVQELVLLSALDHISK